MKSFFILVTSIVLLIPVHTAYGETYNSYKSPYFNFSIDYPSNWELKEISGIAVFLSPIEKPSDDFRENVNVVMEDLGKSPMTLDQYMSFSDTSAAQTIVDYKILERGTTRIDDKNAIFTVFTGVSNNKNLKFKNYVFIRNKTQAFTITYTADPDKYEHFLEQAEQSTQSFVLND